MSKKLILIAGPTASGKSKLAIQLAKKIKGEIFNADSMQVYKEFSILSSKPDKQELKKVKPHQAIKHPKWKMGKKISIDSATLMNKMFEVIEAHKLFAFDLKKIDIVIHPESLVHAIVEFKNGLHEFIYHETTMLIPLANAIFGDDVNIENYLKPKTNTQNFTLSQNLKF